MPEPLTAQTITEQQRNVLSVALLNSERNVALLNQALAAANARIAELEATKKDDAVPDNLKSFASGPPYESSVSGEPIARIGNGANT